MIRQENEYKVSDLVIFSLTPEDAVIKTRALLNILFHPSGTHVNGHLDAVFVLLGYVDTRPRFSQLARKMTTILPYMVPGGSPARHPPHPTSDDVFNPALFQCQQFFAYFLIVCLIFS